MLKVTDMKEVGVGIADKTIGLLIEVTGTVVTARRRVPRSSARSRKR